ncbi:MAG: hypothetical protein MMC23_001567 [Stictis urceolatum]|nr:hypothetical protein [Stictis urceolata]
MAPSDERPPNRNAIIDDENPFIAFRKFADETVASMLQSFIGLPSAFDQPDPRERWLPFDEQARRRTMETWGATAEEGGTSSKTDFQPARQKDNPSEEVGRKQEPRQWGLESNKEPYQPREYPRGSGQTCPQHMHDLVFGSHLNTYQPMCSWLKHYLTYSSYSPLSLETRPDLGVFGTAWRRAFEDLLDAQYGKELKAWDENTLRSGENAMDWFTSATTRPELCECETSGRIGSARRAPQGNEQEQSTELDMYEQFLGERLKKEMKPTEPRGASDERKGLGIISTLTATERVVLPDGSTNTKVVLKKKFADGREESSETVHSTKGQQDSKSISDTTQAFTDTHKDKESSTEKKGWFWN